MGQRGSCYETSRWRGRDAWGVGREVASWMEGGVGKLGTRDIDMLVDAFDAIRHGPPPPPPPPQASITHTTQGLTTQTQDAQDICMTIVGYVCRMMSCPRCLTAVYSCAHSFGLPPEVNPLLPPLRPEQLLAPSFDDDATSELLLPPPRRDNGGKLGLHVGLGDVVALGL